MDGDLFGSISRGILDDTRAATLASILLLVVLVQIWAWARNRRRSLQYYTFLVNSSRGTLHANWGPKASGFFVTIQPPPEPFAQISVLLRVSSILDPLQIVRFFRHYHNNSLLIRGMLASPPQAELVWIRGMPPARALGTGMGRTLWVHQRLDFVNTEFAVRGHSTEALRYVFTDLQRRFNPALRRVIIQQDQLPQVEILVDTARLNAEEIPALITTIRDAGRAALQG